MRSCSPPWSQTERVALSASSPTVPAGTIIATAGSRLRAIHLVIDGRIETEPRAQAWGAHQHTVLSKCSPIAMSSTARSQ